MMLNGGQHKTITHVPILIFISVDKYWELVLKFLQVVGRGEL